MKTTEISLEIKHQTDDAFLLSDGDNDAWIPKSLLDHSPDPRTGEVIAFEMPEWVAIEKEFV